MTPLSAGRASSISSSRSTFRRTNRWASRSPIPMQNKSTLAEIAAVFQARNRFVVMSHARPDGDALGCTLATALCLQQLGKDVTAWNEDGVPEKFRYLPGAELVQPPPAEPRSFDVA